jgi:hypothetical protein
MVVPVGTKTTAPAVRDNWADHLGNLHTYYAALKLESPLCLITHTDFVGHPENFVWQNVQFKAKSTQKHVVFARTARVSG